MRLIILILSTLILSVTACKKKNDVSNLKPIGEFYIYHNGIPLYENPDRGKLIEKIDNKEIITIIETNIPDKVKGFWYKAVHGNNLGYIPLSEETNKNLVAFIYKSQQGRITASSLRIRETPDLKGKVLGSVPKGTIVDIVSEGLVYEMIDDKYDTWMKIKTADGISGYSYAGYISKNLNPDFDEVEGESISGFVEIKETPSYLVSPGGRPVLDTDPAPCGYNMVSALPSEGIIHQTKAKFMHDGIVYYKIESADDSHGCYESYRGWISEKQVTYFEDIYKYTRELYGAKFDRAFLDVINENVNGKLNVKTLEIEPSEFKIKDPGYTFFSVHGGQIYYKHNEQYFYAGPGWGTLVDIDNDGTNEIISDGDCACMCSEATVIIWDGTKLEKIFTEYPEISLHWEPGKNYLKAIRTSDYSDSSKGEETYYEIKNNKLNQLSKKPQI